MLGYWAYLVVRTFNNNSAREWLSIRLNFLIGYVPKRYKSAIRACCLGSGFFRYDENEMRMCVKKWRDRYFFWKKWLTLHSAIGNGHRSVSDYPYCFRAKALPLSLNCVENIIGNITKSAKTERSLMLANIVKIFDNSSQSLYMVLLLVLCIAALVIFTRKRVISDHQKRMLGVMCLIF